VTTLETSPTSSASTAFPSLPAIMLDRARTTPDRLALRHKHLGLWERVTWREYADVAARLGLALRSLGIGRGERVAVHSENRPEWLYLDLGVQGIGAATVGLYPTSAAPEVEYFVNHSGAKLIVVEDEEQLDKILEVRERCPGLERIVLIDTRGCLQYLDDPQILTYDELVGIGAAESIADFEASVSQIRADDVALIVYTSGTTGPPKGAMISHGNLEAASRAARESFGVDESAEVLSYLPLCHIAERVISVVNAVSVGYVVNFGDSPETFAQDIAQVQPTFLLGVPRVWEKMMASVQIRMHDASRFKRWLYWFWTKRGTVIANRRLEGRYGFVDRVMFGIGNIVVFRPLRAKLGLVRCREALSGAAPIAPEVLEYFWSLGVAVREGYGQTENTAQATVNPGGDVRLGTVGTPVADVEVRIADDGEILTRGPHTFLGYLNDEAATAATIDADGWLHTGDVGEMRDGYLTITDRKKDIIITAGGKNISPSEIENALKVSPYIREAIVIGDRRKYLTALIGVELDTVGAWALERQVSYTTYEDLTRKPEVRELVEELVAATNERFARVETIKQFRLLPKELDTEEGELTATQKVKRTAIVDRFGDLIEDMYR
jgi:long-chain acyl-CoA synthetase